MRKSGIPQSAATTLAHRLLPQPCTPKSRMPFGGSKPNARALFVRPPRRRASQRLRLSRPPIWSTVTFTVTASRQPADCSRFRLASIIRCRSSGVRAESS